MAAEVCSSQTGSRTKSKGNIIVLLFLVFLTLTNRYNAVRGHRTGWKIISRGKQIKTEDNTIT